MVKILCVLSGKGGVGKSTAAVNLAYVIRSRGKKVGLVDLDIDGSNIPKLLNMPKAELVVGAEMVEPIDYHGVKVMSMASMVMNDDIPILLRGERKQRFVDQLLNKVNWGDIDYLICDMPPAHGDVTISLLEALGNDIHGVIIVTTPSRIALTDARKTASLCKEYGLRVIGVINNMVGSACAQCGHVSASFGTNENIEKLVEDFGVKVLANIPIVEDVKINPFAIAEYFNPAVDAAMKWTLFG